MKKKLSFLTILFFGFYTVFSQVGINTETPTETLDVDGTIRVRDINTYLGSNQSAKDSILVVDNGGVVKYVSASMIISNAAPTSFPTPDINLVGNNNHISSDAGGNSSGLKNSSNLNKDYGEDGTNDFTGSYNNFIGFESGNNTTTGSYNNFFGSQAGYSNTIGEHNTFVGNKTGYSNTTGNYNNFFGSNTGHNNTTGNSNNFFGKEAGISNTTGSYNSFMGDQTGYSNTTGSYNNFFGDKSGYSNTIGRDNNFFGSEAGYNNTTGSSNNVLGSFAGYYNTTGNYNNFFGQYAGYKNTTGEFNNFIGAFSGKANTTGGSNNFMGQYTGTSNTTGFGNNFIGAYSGYLNDTGSNNNFIGANSGRNNPTGSNNNFMGSKAGVGILLGSNNTLIGHQAGNTLKGGDNNIFIGANTTALDAFNPTPNNTINIGNRLFANENGMGIGTRTPTHTLDVDGEARIRSTSKGNISTDKILLADSNGVVKNIDVSAISIEPWYGVDDHSPATSNSENMYLMSEKIGIGTNNPLEALHIDTKGSTDILFTKFSDGKITDDVDLDFINGRGSSTSPAPITVENNSLGGIRFRTLVDPTQTLNTFAAAPISAEVKSETDGVPSTTSAPGRLVFKTTSIGKVKASNRMVIKNDGKVGIATDSPTHTLDVDGEARIRTLNNGNLSNNLVVADDSTGVLNSITVNQLISTEDNNNITTNTDGGLFYESPIKAMGKVSATGTATQIKGATVSNMSAGKYRVTFSSPRDNNNYIIQLSLFNVDGENSARYIEYTNQTNAGFDVVVKIASFIGYQSQNNEFMFTVLDF